MEKNTKRMRVELPGRADRQTRYGYNVLFSAHMSAHCFVNMAVKKLIGKPREDDKFTQIL